MAIAADRLQIRILERGAAGGDLHDMVDIQLARPSATVADLAGVSVPKHDVRPGRVPEVVTVELPSTPARAVRAPMVREFRAAFDTSAGATSFGATSDPVREPGGRERDDPAVWADHHRRGRVRPRHPSRSRRLDSIGFRCTGNRPTRGAGPSDELDRPAGSTVYATPTNGHRCPSRSASGSIVIPSVATPSPRAGCTERSLRRFLLPRRFEPPTRGS